MIIEFEINDSIICDKGKTYEKAGIIVEFTPLKQAAWYLAADGKRYKAQIRNLSAADNCKIRFRATRNI